RVVLDHALGRRGRLVAHDTATPVTPARAHACARARTCTGAANAGSLPPLYGPGSTDVPDRSRARTGRTPGGVPEPGGRRPARDRPGSAAVQRRAWPGLDRRAGAVAGRGQAIRRAAALGQRGQPSHLRLAARA